MNEQVGTTCAKSDFVGCGGIRHSVARARARVTAPLLLLAAAVKAIVPVALYILYASAVVIATSLGLALYLLALQLQGLWLDYQLRNIPSHHPRVVAIPASETPHPGIPASSVGMGFSVDVPVGVNITKVVLLVSDDVLRPMTNWWPALEAVYGFDGTNCVSTNLTVHALPDGTRLAQMGFVRLAVWTDASQ